MNTDYKTLTLIVPSYNMEQLLDKCLTSCITDEKHNAMLKVIIVNDGSKDATKDIAEKYVHAYPEVFSLIDKTNGNYGSCINVALKQVHSKYVKVLDADDYLDREVLPVYLDYLDGCNADVVINKIRIVDSDGNEQTDKNQIDEEKPDSCGFAEWLNRWSHTPFIHTIAYKTCVFDNLNYHQSEGISYSDSEWVSQPMINVSTIAFFKTKLYNYLIGRDGQTMNPKALVDKRMDRINMVCSLGRRYIEYKGDAIHKKYLFNCFINEVSQLYVNPMWKSVRTDLIKVLEDKIRKIDGQLYSDLKKSSFTWTHFEYVKCYHYGWLYLIGVFLWFGFVEFRKQFNIANYYSLIKPRILVNIASKLIT